MLDYKGLITTIIGVFLLATVGYLYSGVEEARQKDAEQAVINKAVELEQRSMQESIEELKGLIAQTAKKEDLRDLKKLTERLLELQLEERKRGH